MNVLLVEDDPVLVDVLSRNLLARGYSVKAETTAEGAILSMAEEWPDALLLDINLPDDSGWEVLRRLDDHSRQNLGVIVISAAPISPKRIQEFRPARWFQKPFPLDALFRALRELNGEVEPSDEKTNENHV